MINEKCGRLFEKVKGTAPALQFDWSEHITNCSRWPGRGFRLFCPLPLIDYLDRPGGLRKFRDHRELLAANAREAADLAALISGYVDLAGRRKSRRDYVSTTELPAAK
jgi:hypothetical protein